MISKSFRLTIFALVFLISFSSVLAQQVSLANLENGDLIFVGADKENLSGAINRVTQKSADIAFDHVGIVERTADSVFVIHASSKRGSIREPFQSFYSTQKESKTVLAVYRLKQEFQSAIPNAILSAKSMLGKPYNWSYILNDSSYYCSDFVERAFRQDNIFVLEPMTFVNPKTGQIDDFWKEFYKKQNLEVPEGKLGCNPNGLASSEKLAFIGAVL
ncbi:YiiX/YebB-like N1pC/P60 family cysteine hydrolase [Sphingobacterium hungaricum]|uniref:Permuted papain-like amidase enzyme, YaeF/YiiX, C92 family n=1 Tax=Sphingobacterium hungaricum TaxID=2082723 RepID=A0A928UW21_9SPHI|nr:YiiX/YebB-like N1pC/P60 family cysteine hydrolase [Sphingobacterium hungaricum]MBE8712179.1 hypothetical protein [Sphingobacterium hungaricum]